MRIVVIRVVLLLLVAVVILDVVLDILRSFGVVPKDSGIDLGVFVTLATLLATLVGAGSLIKVVSTK
jgi:hypothetical protein